MDLINPYWPHDPELQEQPQQRAATFVNAFRKEPNTILAFPGFLQQSYLFAQEQLTAYRKEPNTLLNGITIMPKPNTIASVQLSHINAVQGLLLGST